MAHGAADVGDRRRDLLEDRRPGRVGHLTHQDVALLQPADLLDRLDHPRGALDHAVGGRDAADLVGIGLRTCRHPDVEVLSGDAPEHDDGRVFDHIGHGPEGRRGLVLGPFDDGRLPLGHDCGPVDRAPRRGVVRPRGHQVDDGGLDLVVGEVEHVLGAREEAVVGQQLAELPDLVEEQVGVPVLAIELVALDVGEDPVRQMDHLVVGGSLLVG